MTEPLNWGERLARVEEKVLHIEDSMDKLVISVEGLVKTINEMSGGWKVLMTVAGLVGGIVAVIGTIYAMRH